MEVIKAGKMGSGKARNAKCQRGQAAVTDALYFLLIITSLAVFLFAFANGYGNSVSQSLQRKYEVDFASSAMETLFNQSIPRDTGASIGTAREADYLLAALKEDYADDMLLNDTNAYLTRAISDVMSPISSARDYLFFFYRSPCSSTDVEDCKDFVYVLLKTSKIPCSASCSTLSLCSPPNADPYVVQNLFMGISGISQSEAKIIFVHGRIGEISMEGKSIPVSASLTMWPATVLNQNAIDAMDCTALP